MCYSILEIKSNDTLLFTLVCFITVHEDFWLRLWLMPVIPEPESPEMQASLG